jgi:hypothetical protein
MRVFGGIGIDFVAINECMVKQPSYFIIKIGWAKTMSRMLEGNPEKNMIE